MKIELKVLNKEFYTKHSLPSYTTPGAAAMDLVCTQDIVLYPGERKLIPTGLAIWIGSSGRKRTYTTYKTTSKCNHVIWNPCSQCATTYMYRQDSVDVEGTILPRSGLGSKGLILANTVGLIDEDYQGELMVSVWNSNTSFSVPIHDSVYEINAIKIKAGERFAQIKFAPIIKVQWDVVEEFSNKTDRNSGGFGSTDV